MEFEKVWKNFGQFSAWKSLENFFLLVWKSRLVILKCICIILIPRLMILLLTIVPESDLGMSFRKVMSRKGLEKVLKKYGNLHSKLHRSPGEETDEFF